MKLNSEEKKVYDAALVAIKNENGQFCQSRDIAVEGMNKNQIAGYLSQLQQKKALVILTDSDCYKGQVSLPN